MNPPKMRLWGMFVLAHGAGACYNEIGHMIKKGRER